MQKKNPPNVWKGIPYSDVTGKLDPRSVYESSAKRRARAANGLERFAYLVFGPQLISSIAFALDPWSEYRFPTMKITPANRTTKLQCVVPKYRGVKGHTTTTTCASHQDPLLTCGVSSTTGASGVTCGSGTVYGPQNNLSVQQAIPGFRKDTTVRTRPIGSKGGEFELYVPFVSCPPRNSSSSTSSKIIYFANIDCLLQWSEQRHDKVTLGLGPGAAVDPSLYSGYPSTESTRFSQLASKLALGMVRESLPTRRKYTLFRNIAELKDLPLLLRKTTELYRDAPSLLELKGQGSQYLNYEFGWKATYEAILDMLKAPELITKQVNYLILRNGLSTSFRARRSGLEEFTGAGPNVNYDIYGDEYGWEFNYGPHRRQWSMHSVINYTLKFPSIDIPKLREDLFTDLLGTNPRPSDVYDLVPWTWLVDWFGGLGEYIDLMNSLAVDPSVFNYGYLTYKAEVRMPVRFIAKRLNSHGVSIDGVSSSQSWETKFTHTTVPGYRYTKRIDISSVAGMKALSRPNTLSGGQLAIIGALLTKFASN